VNSDRGRFGSGVEVGSGRLMVVTLDLKFGSTRMLERTELEMNTLRKLEEGGILMFDALHCQLMNLQPCDSMLKMSLIF
jgi:hypothetical protein